MAQHPAPPEDGKKPKSFEALTPELSSWILDYTASMNFTRTTPVQSMAIPLLMGNKDLVVEAVTGSGKTLAFLIPIVERLLRAEEPNKKGYVRSIVVAPTKELAVQIYEVLEALLQFHPPSHARLHPAPIRDEDDDDAVGTEDQEPPPAGPFLMPQLLIGGRTKLNEDLSTFTTANPNILIGTPKRLSEVLASSKVILKRHWFDLLVLDEADRLLDANFQGDVQKILELTPKERRTGLFSASVSEAVNELVRVGMRYPFKISAKVRNKQTGALDKRTPESLRLCYLITPPTHKLPLLKHILTATHATRSIVYVSTRAGVDYWSHILPALLETTVIPLHGDHKAAFRAKNLRKFKSSLTPAILLTTDVLARGIDIPDVDLVAQLDPPSQPKDFIHRCGRSGRAGKRGTAVAFLSPGSEADYLRYLETSGNTKLEPYAPTPDITPTEAATFTSRIHALLTHKRELHDRSQRAFVSWAQAYSKTLPADIFDLSKISWAEQARAWGLLRWPKMPELKKHFPAAMTDRSVDLALPEDFQLEKVSYVDPAREAHRLAVAAGDLPFQSAKRDGEGRRKTDLKGAGADARRKRDRAWSGRKQEKVLREERRERKVSRRKHEELERMSESERGKMRELEDLVRRVREKRGRDEEEERRRGVEGEWEGFGD